MTLAEKVIEVAAAYVGVRETAPNRGPEIDAWILGAAPWSDLSQRLSWCRAFVHGCFAQAARELGVPNPCPLGLSVMKSWEDAQPFRKSLVPKPGRVGVIRHARGRGHTFLVEVVSPLHLITLEGNTNDNGSREGDGVYRRTRRIEECVGFMDYAATMPKDLVA